MMVTQHWEHCTTVTRMFCLNCARGILHQTNFTSQVVDITQALNTSRTSNYYKYTCVGLVGQLAVGHEINENALS